MNVAHMREMDKLAQLTDRHFKIKSKKHKKSDSEYMDEMWKYSSSLFKITLCQPPFTNVSDMEDVDPVMDMLARMRAQQEQDLMLEEQSDAKLCCAVMTVFTLLLTCLIAYLLGIQYLIWPTTTTSTNATFTTTPDTTNINITTPTTSTPTTTVTPRTTTYSSYEQLFEDCEDALNHDIIRSGVYKVKPTTGRPFDVLCDMHSDGGGWTTILIRSKGRILTDYDVSWREYAEGFGVHHTDHWLGNNYIHMLTHARDQELRIEMTYNNKMEWGKYKKFSVASIWHEFELSVSEFDKSSTLDDAMTRPGASLDKRRFTTYDNDNDDIPFKNCAEINKSGFWWNSCGNVNVGGIFGSPSLVKRLYWIYPMDKPTKMKMMVRRSHPTIPSAFPFIGNPPTGGSSQLSGFVYMVWEYVKPYLQM